MPRNVEPAVYLIAKTVVDTDSASEWLSRIGVSEEAWLKIAAGFNSGMKTNAELLTELAGRRCYMSYEPGMNPNVQKIRQEIAAYITNVLNVKHGSILEHTFFTFAIENASRVFTGEMNRHRAGTAISEGSMRYIRYRDIPYWIPTSFRYGDTPLTDGDFFDTKEQASRASMARVFKMVESEYAYLCEVWAEELAPESTFHKKKEITSALRRIIPMGVATGGVWTGNTRALRHICEMRCSSAAEEEILLVVTMMLALLKQHEPNLFGDFSTDEKGFSTPKYSKV